ncbi:MAG: type VI secretion system baseplate subunit TssG [Verrucomicrobia bacterium]|nr:type VI secretion system baseplate subunit TssG [Verrucomicrobiota bacterium]
MAEPDRQTSDNLAEEITSNPYAFNFYRAVRMLEAEFRDRPRVGNSIRLEEDFLRFCQIPSLSFAPSTLEGAEQVEKGLRLFVNFLGMFGPNGPLPQHLTDFARDRYRNAHDPTFVRFMDVFHHRMLSFFYRAWALNQKSADFDRPEESRYANYFGSLFGIAMPGLRERDTVPDPAKIYFSGHLAAQSRNAEGLEAILGDFFGVPTEIQEFAGFWMKIPPENQCRLGESPETGTLGVNAIAGSQKYEAQLKFRIRMGPMELEDLKRLVPAADNFKKLKDWVLNYINRELFWDLQCVLKAPAVPAISLGQDGLLGWTTWLKSQPFHRDVDDPIFDPQNY